MKDQLKIFTGRSNPTLSKDIANYLGKDLGKLTIKTFSDGELWLQFEVRDQVMFIRDQGRFPMGTEAIVMCSHKTGLFYKVPQKLAITRRAGQGSSQN